MLEMIADVQNKLTCVDDNESDLMLLFLCLDAEKGSLQDTSSRLKLITVLIYRIHQLLDNSVIHH